MPDKGPSNVSRRQAAALVGAGMAAAARGGDVPPPAPNPVGYHPRTGAEVAAGVAPTNYAHPPGNVLRYGADPTGTVPSDAAIQAAIDSLNNWQKYSPGLGNKAAPGVDFSQGGEVFIPAGLYSISKPILLAPNIRLRGATPVRFSGTDYGGSGQHITVLRAGSSFPALQYLVDSGVYRLKNESTGAPVTPRRVVAATELFARGNELDDGVCNFMQSITVEDLQLDGNNHAAGGLRIQGGAFFYVDGVSVINTQYVGFSFNCCFEFGIGRVAAVCPAPLVMIACESAMQDGGELQLYAVASSSWVTANQPTINAIIYPANDFVGSWYALTLKAINIQWCINVTFGYLSANAGAVGIELYHSNCNILHWENEYTERGALFLLRSSKCRCDGLSTKSRSALASGDGSSRLVLREPHFIQCSTSFTPLNGERSSNFEVQVHNYWYESVDPILGVASNLSTVNLSRWFPYHGAVTLHVDASAGNAANAGLIDSSPTTIDGALRFITNNPQIREWQIRLAGGQTHTITRANTCQDVSVHVVAGGGSAARLALDSSLTLVNARLELAHLAVTSTRPQMFLCQGIVNIEFNTTSLTIAGASVIFAPAVNTTAKIVGSGRGISIAYGTGAGTCSGGSNGYAVYEDSFAAVSITGAFALEAITRGKVHALYTNLQLQ